MNKPIVIALTKGRPLSQLIDLLARLGIRPKDNLKQSRKLVFPTNDRLVQLMVLRGMDVATYVEHGIADVGMVGKDVLLEYGGNGFYEPIDLDIVKCRIVVAGLVDENSLPRRIKVATKFVEVTKRFYAHKGVQADIIKLSGAMELAPLMGLAHRIVDIVETGDTLRANGLEEKELVAEVSARLIVNKVSLKTKYEDVQDIIKRLGVLCP
ncbi:MAG: ATP phosphoribosyltransferase [Gammaproteobacteria bacterium]|jgi:ATP phosphoribosyltransferase|nr:ATP phosphoribosyltransferase [Gammaproteobacteria bacterium]MBT5203319.1 ATP phosphoribosyltransferase [Gammaproteobacteria bacterium]MBT5600636.1 ATP phosphoribosyltransferase [Gammaproteobacteria bacterium]MBT6244571.1 ATP phosphoribosyltransferase [Gammaproteobacteria bacterium]